MPTQTRACTNLIQKQIPSLSNWTGRYTFSGRFVCSKNPIVRTPGHYNQNKQTLVCEINSHPVGTNLTPLALDTVFPLQDPAGLLLQLIPLPSCAVSCLLYLTPHCTPNTPPLMHPPACTPHPIPQHPLPYQILLSFPLKHNPAPTPHPCILLLMHPSLPGSYTPVNPRFPQDPCPYWHWFIFQPLNSTCLMP